MDESLEPSDGHGAPLPVTTAASWVNLAAGVLVFIAASATALLVAGELGVAGVVIAALIEGVAVLAIYRWCEA